MAEGAFDAAVATALVLGVVNPQSGGLGGVACRIQAGGWIVRPDFQGVPRASSARTPMRAGRDSARGPWAVGIPGEPAGLAALHRRGGKLPWARLVEPARKVAAEGFVVGQDLAAVLKRSSAEVLDDPLRSVFAPEGGLGEGALCRRPALAETLSRHTVGIASIGAPWPSHSLASCRGRGFLGPPRNSLPIASPISCARQRLQGTVFLHGATIVWWHCDLADA